MTFDEGRALFPVLERFAYLNAGSLGPLSRPTLTAMEERLRFDQEQGRGGHGWFTSVLELRARVREELARLIGASPTQMALTDSTTDGCNIVLSGLELGPDDEVVTTDSEHPGLLLPLHVSGARVRVAEVAARPTANALQAILSCVTPRTRLLALSHVLWTTGQVMPLHELKRETGLPILVDGAQSVGTIPVEVGELDYYTVSCQKWLCGPEPLGALYVRDPEELRVGIPSGFAQKSLEPDGRFVPAEGAARFDSGWLATPSLAGLEAALAGAPEWRFERAAEMAALCRAALRERFEIVGDGEQSTLVSFIPAGDAAAQAARLYDGGVIVRDLPGTGWLRASCGWWTSGEDVDRLLSALG
ncbi:MAG: aminotransferase class V-fold PLP-dependent enzyme [Actinobacteria bacterium]|nr:MAG: aminotransferase class V-fold PLP-dependent enzyme [Actinomycetota bacterium]